MKKHFFLAFCATVNFGLAQEATTYKQPTEEILKLVDYQRPPSVLMNSQKTHMVLAYRDTYKSLEALAKEDMKLAGLRIDPVTNISSTTNFITNLKLQKVGDKKVKEIKNLPVKPQIAFVSFSPDEKFIAFTNTTEKGVELWVVEIAKGEANKLTPDNLNANMGQPYSWFADSKTLLVNQLPADRPALLDKEKDLPKGPIVEVTTGEISQNRTYQDMLKTPLDEKNFEILVTSQLIKVALDGKTTPFAKADLYSNVSFSPDGKLVMVSIMQRPFSYVVPYYRFPFKTVIYDLSAKEIKTVNEVPLSEVVPKGFSSVRKGKRNMAWRSDQPSTLYFVEALDNGDQEQAAEFRDQVYTWGAPFTASPQPFFKTKDRYGGIEWGNAENAFINEFWYNTRNQRTTWINPTTKESKLIEDRNYQDIYNDPGSFQTAKNNFGRYTVQIENNKAIRIGEGYTKDGQFPFVSEVNLRDLTEKRLYTFKNKDAKENIIDVMDAKKGDLLVMEQSSTEFPNYYKKNFKSGKITPLTNFENPFKSLNGIHKEVISYKRADGVELSGILYLPANYDMKTKKEKLPLLMWAYPEEYTNKATAGMTTQNPNSFTYPSYGSFIYWAAKGYAVLQDASFPIIGAEGAEPNDTFVEQLVADAKAAIDAVDKLGYIDRTKVAVGGHSYGAFMTANLLTHSDLFACGIARSGAYNRTLTPFGFQSEQRNYWDNPDLYNTMSPFMNANKMKTPILLIHGDADNNSGTFKVQTERYFQALKNLGAPAKMVLLPFESHGYVAKENILHLLYEQDIFLEKCLKN